MLSKYNEISVLKKPDAVIKILPPTIGNLIRLFPYIEHKERKTGFIISGTIWRLKIPIFNLVSFSSHEHLKIAFQVLIFKSENKTPYDHYDYVQISFIVTHINHIILKKRHFYFLALAYQTSHNHISHILHQFPSFWN